MKTKGLFGEVNVTGSCDYMIEVSYGEKDWGMPQGIREVLANMLDTKTEYDAHYDKDNGYCVILDHGTGLPKKALVMGASSTYPIAKDYVQSWSILDAGREVLANAIDS